MAAKRIIADDDFGQIVLRSRRGARNITMRVKPDVLYLTVPPRSRTEAVLEALRPFRARLLEQYLQVKPKRIDFDYSIQAECFRLSLAPGSWKCFTIRHTEEGMVIYCPPGTDFALPDIQLLLRNAIIRALKRAAESYLPPLLATWAERFRLTYNKVRITGARSRWGSCSGTRTNSLSCYLMLVPAHLMDYVILHELAHTKEMNHGPRFWELLDSFTEGQSLRLRAELRKFRTAF